MAKKFSAASAAVSGWGVLAREPLLALVWAAVLLVILIAPIVALFTPVLGDLSWILSMDETAAADDPAMFQQMMAVQGRMMLANIGTLVVQVVAQTIIVGAVFRAVLTPADRGWFYLRLGAAEGWLMLVTVVGFVGWYIVYLIGIVLALIVGFVAYFVGAAAGGTAAGAAFGMLIGVVAFLVALAFSVWALLRLSMAWPMSFSQRRFILFEAWSLTKGQSLRLFGMALLAMLTILAAELVVIILGLVVFYMTGPDALADLGPSPSLEQVVDRFWPFLLALAPVLALFQAVVLAVYAAPWAVAYQGLTRVEPVAEPADSGAAATAD